MCAETRHPVRQLVQTEPCGSTRNDIDGQAKVSSGDVVGEQGVPPLDWPTLELRALRRRRRASDATCLLGRCRSSCSSEDK